MDKITRLTIANFTVFKDAEFEFAPGVNTLIGENGTGKSHVLKLLYALSEAQRRIHSGETGLTSKPNLDDVIGKMLVDVFQPDHLGRLVRRGKHARTAHVELAWGAATLSIDLTFRDRLTTTSVGLGDLERAIFLPPREVLSIFPGFVAEWDARESAFDRTYRDLCEALARKPLRGARGGERGPLLEPIEAALGGTVVLDPSGKFYVELPDGKLEAPLVAEGLRKLAMVNYLLVNGSLTRNGFLLWDEPEANLNPKLAHLAGRLAFGLSRLGIQVLLATHDYSLCSELSMLAEAAPQDEAAFFALARDATGGVTPQRAPVFTALNNNAILESLGELHDRELAAMAAGTTS
jgi:energy-coupling factor transporter ATP-binding protein EcfA2